MKDREIRRPEPISIIGLYATEHAQDPLPGELHPPTLDKIPLTRVTAALDAAKQIPIFGNDVQIKKAA